MATRSPGEKAFVTKPLPNYPRLYREAPPEPAPRGGDHWPGLDKLCRAFERATGWPLECMPGEPPAKDVKLVWSAPDEAAAAGTQVHVGLASRADDAPPPPRAAQVELPSAVELAVTLGELLAEVGQLRRALWRREADLAAGVPVSPHRNTPQHLAERLEASLAGAAQAVGCHAAALYLLDESTTHLKLRSVWGLPRQTLLAPPRELSAAQADLEALLGHAVVLEDTGNHAGWRVPEEAAAAICVPVSSATIPLGTLWVFGQQSRAFSDAEVNMVEIVAGRIAAELERETLLASGVEGARLQRQWAAAARWQEEQLPRTAPLVDGWQVAGWTRAESQVGGGFYDWFVRDDDSLAVAVANCPSGDGRALEAALAAATLQAAVRAQGEHLAAPNEVLERLNRSLWRRSTGGQTADLFYAAAQPGEGRIEYAAAGTMNAWVLSPRGARRLPESNQPLGIDPEARFAPCHADIGPDEALFVFSSGVASSSSGAEPSQNDVVEELLSHLDQPASVLSELARDRLQAIHDSGDCTALVLKRRSGFPA